MRSTDTDARITVTANGPYEVHGSLPLARQVIVTDDEGGSREWQEGQALEVSETYRLCRCGKSSSKPFCDDSHLPAGFDGTETANNAPYLEQAEIFDGPTMALTDAEVLCAFARFCDPDGQVWNLIEQTADPAARDKVRHEAGHCPSGRLVAWEKESNATFEPAFEPSLGLVQDTHLGLSGPIWVRGGIPIESENGTRYEVRNRVTLCRCGASGNKPFCDGSHASVKFKDESENR